MKIFIILIMLLIFKLAIDFKFRMVTEEPTEVKTVYGVATQPPFLIQADPS